MTERSSRRPQDWRTRLRAYARIYRSRGEGVVLATAVLVGLGAGVGAIAFRWLIALFTRLSFEQLPELIRGWGLAYLIVAPVVGGVAVGLLIHFFAREARGHGVPEVMESVALRGGRIRPVVAVIKSLASSICIGSGGSVGREGPIVQIGSTLGSSLGQVLRLSDDGVRNLVACGAAGGIAATFNAPIAGVFFALEVILGDFSVRAFGSVIVSAVTASIVGRAAFGDVPAFAISDYAINSIWEYPMYVVLGLVAALVGAVYTRTLYHTEDLFDSWRGMPEWLKPAVGGLLLGLVAIGYRFVPGLGYDTVPQIYGVGYGTIEVGLLGRAGLVAMIALAALKIVATSLTLGSGGSGGVFAPSLFIGSMVGGSFGRIMHAVFPGLPGPSGAFALVGMGALFAGAAHAPLTAVIMIFEMTGDYLIVLPLMLAVATATVVGSALLGGESIYTLKLSRRGVRLARGQDVDVLRGVRVGEVMSRNPATVLPTTPLRELTRLILSTNRHAFPVVDERKRLVGIVSLTDLRKVEDSDLENRQVGNLMTRTLVTVSPEDSLDTALLRMGPKDLSRLPVVSRDDPQRLLGVIRRSDVVRAYNLALTRRSHPAVDAPSSLRRAERVEFIEIDLPDDSPCIGKTVAEVSPGLPAESLLVSIRRREGETIFPHGKTDFRVGDRVTAYARRGNRDLLRRHFGAEATAGGPSRA